MHNTTMILQIYNTEVGMAILTFYCNRKVYGDKLLKALILATNLSSWQLMIHDKPNWVYLQLWSSSNADFIAH
jgi:hypothetical protein